MDDNKRRLFRSYRHKERNCPNCGYVVEAERKSPLLFLGAAAFIVLGITVSSNIIPYFFKPPAGDVQAIAVTVPRSDIDRLKNEATAYFKSDPQGVAIEAIWTSMRELTIGVNRDSRNYDDYAQNACEVLMDRGLGSIENLRVDIVDLVQVRENGNWRPIGRADCNRIQSVTLSHGRTIY